MIENTLILGLAAGLHYGDVRPFVASLEQTGFAGECVLFVSPTTRGVDEIRRHGVRCIKFERPRDMEHVPYNAFRYFLYLGFLRTAPMRYRRILVTDVRDVMFQSNPFAYSWSEGLNATLEDRSMAIGDCPYMTRWLSGHLGGTALGEISPNPISCSGTTVGTHDSMLAYLERLTTRLLPFTPGKQMAGYDQGVHNHLLHTGCLDDLAPALHDNTGPILTLGYKKESPPLTETGKVLNDAGTPAIIVHQYDRKAELHRFVRNKY